MSNQAEETAESVFDRGVRTPNFHSHTHKPLRQILREQNIGSVERLLLWLAKTDYYILHVVPNNCRMTLSSLGMMVLFTSLLAFGSAFYTLVSMVILPESILGYLLAAALATLYAFGIMIIDREIVGATSSKALFIRFFFAIGIALVVSWPVKVRLFEGHVQQEIVQMVTEEHEKEVAELEQLKRQNREALELQVEQQSEQRALLRSKILSIDKELVVLDEEIAKEADKVKCGPICLGLRNEKEELMAQRSLVENQLAELSGPISLPDAAIARVQAKEAELKQMLDPEVVRANRSDILSKWVALKRIKEDLGPEYDVMSYFVLIFFMLLEMVPLGLKLSLGKTEYQYYLEARTQLNNQKIIGIANYYLHRMDEQEDAVIREVPAEITDMMAWHIEDESRERRANFDTRSLRDIDAVLNRQREDDHLEDATDDQAIAQEQDPMREVGDMTVEEDAPQRA